MASTINIKENKHYGFSQPIEKILNYFGVGLNEEYTDLLVNCYFNKTISYDIEKKPVQLHVLLEEKYGIKSWNQ